MFEVIKPFNTTNRRFKAGDRIYRGDNLSPHSIDSLIKSDFVVNRLTEKSGETKKQKTA